MLTVQQGCDIRHRRSVGTAGCCPSINHTTSMLGQWEAYEVPILSSHLQASVPLLMAVIKLPIAYYVLESMTTSPVSSSGTEILVHGVGFSKIVPRPKEINGSCTWRCLAMCMSAYKACIRYGRSESVLLQDEGHKGSRRHVG